MNSDPTATIEAGSRSQQENKSDTTIQDAKALEDNAKQPKTPTLDCRVGLSTSVRERGFVRMNIVCQKKQMSSGCV